MPRCCIDHITVTAPTLAAGAAFVRDALGVEAQPGGEHPRMGTHNLLLRLGDALFLEVIAANPAAPAPGRPRWFALDTLTPQSPPALATWVVRTADIRATQAAASEPLGNIEPMSRGALDWLITIPADGALPLDGAGPALIEWHTDAHPASRLPDCGLSLARLEIIHPQPARVSRLLQSLQLDGPLVVTASPSARLVAYIDTPGGERRLAMPAPCPDNPLLHHRQRDIR
ncbi:MAG: VOC family protein [Rhodocyclales bacterium]|nr:VOC family protein [Rhodocyclales bacterium]